METNDCAIRKQETPHLSFLDLPAEARNWIYDARLRIVTKSGKRKALTVDEFRLRLQMLQPLLLANKQIMLEATPLFLGTNTLHLKAEGFDQERLQCGSRPRILISYATKYVWGHKYCYRMEVPPLRTRHLFKHLAIMLYGPAVSAGRTAFMQEDQEWLYPIRELKAMKFMNLHSLSIEVLYDYTGGRREEEFEAETRRLVERLTDIGELNISCSRRNVD